MAAGATRLAGRVAGADALAHPGKAGTVGRVSHEPPAAEVPLHGGRAIWLTGLSGSGKSTVAELVASQLRARGQLVEVLDGDVVRRVLSADLGFSRADRDTNVRRIAFVADLLSRNGVTAIVALISPYREAREQARRVMAGRFVEVYVKASVEVCVRRDVKGLYRRALAGELQQFTGVSDPYEEPLSPDVVLDTEAQEPEHSAATVLAYLGYVGATT
jgi:adenylylsulfate kinase